MTDHVRSSITAVALTWISLAASSVAVWAQTSEPAAASPAWALKPTESLPAFCAVNGGHLLVFTNDGVLRRYALGSGAPGPEVQIGVVPASRPAFLDKRAIIAAKDGSVGCYNLETGAAIWRNVNVATQFSDPVISGAVVYVGSGAGNPGVWGFSLVDGSVVLHQTTPNSILSPPAVAGDAVYAGTVSGSLLRISGAIGMGVAPLVNTRGIFCGQHIGVLDNGSLLIAPTGDERRVSLISTTDGAALWSISFAHSVYADFEELNEIEGMHPLAKQAALGKVLSLHKELSGKQFDPTRDFLPTGPVHTSSWVTSGTTAGIVVKESGFPPQALYHVLLVDIASGKKLVDYTRNIQEAPLNYCHPPVIRDKSIVALLGRALLVSIDRDSGQLQWEYQVSDQVVDQFEVAGNTVLVKTQAGEVVAVRLPQAIALPQAFALYQNWPNPFRYTTTIRYAIPLRCKVRVTVFNGRGQSVGMLENSVKSPGVYSVTWGGGRNGKDAFATGMYYVKLSAGVYTKSIRMLLTRS